MFKKPPKESRAIPIVAPSSHQKAIQEAAAAVASLRIGLAPSASTNIASQSRPPAAQWRTRSPAELAVSQDASSSGFNIYARPFVSQAFLDINQQIGSGFFATEPRKTIHFAAYAEQAFGPAVFFLPPIAGGSLPPPSPPARTLPLGPRNYKSYFDHLLAREAEAECCEIEASFLYGHELTILPVPEGSPKGESLCSLQVPGLRENTPLLEEDDIVELRQLIYRDLDGQDSVDCHQLHGWTQTVYHARIANIIRMTETIVLRVHGLPKPVMKSCSRFNVKFLLPAERRFPMLVSVQDAHDALSADGWLHSQLFPSKLDCEIQEQLHPGVFAQEFFDQRLNWEQKKAVESIVSCSYGTLPYLISGPPGTGKTKTIIETVLQLTKRTQYYEHILLCAPSDPAADTLCQRLIAHLGPDEMLRLTRPYRTFAEVPDALLPYCCIEHDKFALPPFASLMRFRVVVTTCRDAELLVRARMTNRDLFAVESCMQNISAAIHPSRGPPDADLHWSAVIIDEAAQAMEPEALIPFNVVAPPKDFPKREAPLAVMAGDEHQLGPRTFVPSSPLQESLFARLSRRPVYADHPLARGKKGEPPTPLTRSLLPVLRPAFTNLIRNYRSHPAILAVPSNLFYWDTLEPEATETERLAGWNAWRGRGWPILFHDNASPDELDRPGLMQGNGGWFNRGEAGIARSYAQSLVHSGKVAPEELCIMSPFKAQVRYLRQCMRESGLWGANIGPTEAFQGLESGVVILCVTRANKKFVEEDQKLGWGIIGTPNKMNVALTRAKFGLIIVGSRELLVEDPNWKALVDFCDRNGLVTEASEHNSENNGNEGAGACMLRRTRLEGVLIDKERRSKESPGRAWGLLYGVEQGQEMWNGGMFVSSSRIEDEDGDEKESGGHFDSGYDFASEDYY